MDENRERGKGKLEEVGGSIREAVGAATGNERMEAEGSADRLEGQGRQEVAKGVGEVKGAAEEVKGSVKQAWGSLTGDDSTHAEGHVDELKGDVRQKLNQ